jgi:DNA-binding transcriptional MerR regulator
LTIGDFARATHLSVKALRYYHSVGVLKPAAIDPATGYRRYRTDQIAVAQIIRRFRSLDMPIEDIQSILAAPDVAIRSQVIATHLNRLEELLDRTHRATASLRDLLQAQAAPPLTDLAHVSVPAGFSGGDHRVAGFEHNIYALNRAHDAHVAVQKYLCFENVHVARAKTGQTPCQTSQPRVSALATQTEGYRTTGHPWPSVWCSAPLLSSIHSRMGLS